MNKKYAELKIIAFDADDTLWVNEPYFQETEHKFCALLEDYLSHHTVGHELFKTEIANLALYGYGVKGFMLSMVETAIRVSNGTVSASTIEKMLDYGKQLLAKPIELLEGVAEVLSVLKQHFLLVVATKGDLLDQQRKLKNSGLAPYFHHIEIMSDKQPEDYKNLINRLSISPDQFLMVGNSLKSDVLPVLELGSHSIHIPFHTTWAHEKVDAQVNHPNFWHADNIRQIPKHLLNS